MMNLTARRSCHLVLIALQTARGSLFFGWQSLPTEMRAISRKPGFSSKGRDSPLKAFE